MSRILVLGAAFAALAGGIAAASAADIPVYTPPVAEDPVYSPTSAYNWSGAYVGLLGGYNWGHATTSAPAGTPAVNGFQGGVFAGYNWQAPNNFVFGLEGDISLNAQKGSIGGLTVSNPWNGTFRGRVGYAFDRFMVYGTGGLAVGSIKGSAGGLTDKETKLGWTAGVGVEAALTRNLTARLEYRHTDFGTANLATAPGTSVDLKSNALMFGVGFKF